MACLLIAATFAPRLCAQNGAKAALSGVVTDASGAVVPGAKITLTFATSGVQHKVSTAAAGSFFFLQLNAGEYRVAADAPGFGRAYRKLTYQGAPIHVDLVLPAARGRTELTVNAANSNPTEPAHVEITAQDIDRMPTESVNSPFSSLITMTTPGVAADSNGSFHPLGDHAEAQFVIDGQPITDQQSRIFSNQISLNTLQSVEVLQGAPGADVGDKTSMVIVAQTRSGLDQRAPHGALAFSRGSFATSTASGNLAFGTAKFGSFTAVDALNSERFLDVPETVALHANGNAENFFERIDYRAEDRTTLQLNASFSRSWFQTPNTFDQNAIGQNQRQAVLSFNVAPQMLHVFNAHAFNQTNLWVRQDKVRYRPSDDIFSDSPAYLEQARRLTNTGIRDQFSYSQGRHNAAFGGEFKHTFLAEQFATALTDPTFNSPCLGPDGAPSAETRTIDPAQCAPAGLTPDNAFLPSLIGIDLTRGGSIYRFRGYKDIKQAAFYGQDFIKFGNFTAQLGLRFDKYNGLANSHGVQPRAGLVYSASPIKTNFHFNYSRVFITPYNENLIVASSAGPGSVSAVLGAANSAILTTGRRNQFNVGLETAFQSFSLSAEYLWKYTSGAYDFDVLLNSPLTFPTQFRQSKIDGALARLTLKPARGFSGFATISHVRSRLFGPEIGGISFTKPYSAVARPDHDQGLAMNLNLRYQFGQQGPLRGVWINASYRYDGGLVAVAVPDIPTALQLTGDEQQQMGLHCGSVFATVSIPLRSCSGPISATRIRIPPLGTENDDRNPPRIAVRNTIDMSFGQDNLIRRENQSLGIRAEIVNLTNVKGLYNFLSTFSGTHFLTPRTITIGLRYTF